MTRDKLGARNDDRIVTLVGDVAVPASGVTDDDQVQPDDTQRQASTGAAAAAAEADVITGDVTGRLIENGGGGGGGGGGDGVSTSSTGAPRQRSVDHLPSDYAPEHSVG